MTMDCTHAVIAASVNYQFFGWGGIIVLIVVIVGLACAVPPMLRNARRFREAANLDSNWKPIKRRVP